MAAKRQFEARYEMYVKPWHPELAIVGMYVLSLVLSTSSCNRNRSAHGYIYSKIRNRLERATTEKLVHVCSNSKWWQRLAILTNSRSLLGIMKVHSCGVTASGTRPTSGLWPWRGPIHRVAKSRLRDSVRLGQP